MPGIRLTQRRVDALPRRRAVRDVRDTELKGYGVRVMPSGAKRYFIHSQHQGRRVWKIVGDAGTMTEAEARARARSMLAALRDGRGADAEAPGEAPFETVAEEVFTRYARRWKPRTLQVNRNLPSKADPAFLQRTSHRSDNRKGRARLVSLAPRDTCGGEPLGADPVRHHAAGGSLGLPPREQQPLQGHPPLPTGTFRALPVSRRIPSPRQGPGPSRGGSPALRGSCPPASPDGMPQVGDPYPRMAFLPGRKNLSARQQGRGRARSGCALQRGMSWTVCRGRPDGSSRSKACAPRGIGWIPSGGM